MTHHLEHYKNDGHRACYCGDCAWQGTEDDLSVRLQDGIPDLDERLNAGSEVPAGECPECESLVYVRTPYTQARDAAELLLVACQAAEFWLVEEARNPGQATPEEILRVLRAAIANATGEAA